MADFHPHCPKCDKIMDRGHVPDALDHASSVLARWTPGAPEERRFFGGLKVRPDYGVPLAAYRCPGCGYVEFYARPG
jgi:hypothetical protein